MAKKSEICQNKVIKFGEKMNENKVIKQWQKNLHLLAIKLEIIRKENSGNKVIDV